jgi:uncharacterized protein (DUF433 family)
MTTRSHDQSGVHPPPEHGEIVDRGRGPELKGTRITVYRVMDYLEEDVSTAEIAAELGVTEGQVDVAMKYIHSHEEDLVPEYRAILDRANRPKPRWVEEGLARTVEELRERIKERYPARERP